jgi:hypothetical protein
MSTGAKVDSIGGDGRVGAGPESRGVVLVDGEKSRVVVLSRREPGSISNGSPRVGIERAAEDQITHTVDPSLRVGLSASDRSEVRRFSLCSETEEGKGSTQQSYKGR